MGLHHLAFSFEGILIGSVLYSMPFAVQPLTEAFNNLGRRPVEVASSLGAGVVDSVLHGDIATDARGIFGSSHVDVRPYPG